MKGIKKESERENEKRTKKGSEKKSERKSGKRKGKRIEKEKRRKSAFETKKENRRVIVMSGVRHLVKIRVVPHVRKIEKNGDKMIENVKREKAMVLGRERGVRVNRLLIRIRLATSR